MKRISLFMVLAVITSTILTTCKKDDESNVELPTINTLAVTEITGTTAKSGGNITNDGGADITAKGVVWRISQNPTFEQHTGITIEGKGTGLFQSALTSLASNTIYFVRAYATNSAGTAYGDQVEFKTKEEGSAPVADFDVDTTSGTAPLSVNFNDQSTNEPISWQWDFGDGNNSTEQNPEHIYESPGTYTVQLTVSNNFGSDTGIKADLIQVDQAGSAPLAAFTANPTSGYIPLTVSFNDQSTNKPTSWQWDFGDGNSSTEQNPEHTYQSPGSYTVELSVSNSFGNDTKIVSDYITVSSPGGTGEPCPGIPTFTYGGQTYNTVLIGDQCWMKENLNYEFGASWCYNNDTTNCNTYGRLYTWSAALNVCPPGWHLPGDDEWKILEGTVDSQYETGHSEWDLTGFRGHDAGQNLKTISGWNTNGNGTDDYGFSAFPGGHRNNLGNFDLLGVYGFWWSSTEQASASAFGRRLDFNSGKVYRNDYFKGNGFSVRCIKY